MKNSSCRKIFAPALVLLVLAGAFGCSHIRRQSTPRRRDIPRVISDGDAIQVNVEFTLAGGKVTA